MSLRTVLLIALILLVAGFVALNLETILQPSRLNLAITEVDAPIGLVMLGMLVVLFLIFLAALVYFQTAHLMEVRRITREAEQQRELADKAEASRFTELRAFLAAEIEAMSAREKATEQGLTTRLETLQQALTAHMDQNANGLSACLGELEDRLEQHLPPLPGRT